MMPDDKYSVLLVVIDQQAERPDVYTARYLPRLTSDLHRWNHLFTPSWEIRRQDVEDAERV